MTDLRRTYPCMTAYHWYMGASQDLLDRELKKAAALDAPEDAVYLDVRLGEFIRVEDLLSDETRGAVVSIVARIARLGPARAFSEGL